MIRIFPGDLLAVRAKNRYYYALLLERVRLFGGNWSYAFHRSSGELLQASELLAAGQPGFHAFIDFIWAKRENRIERLAKKVNVEPYNSVRRLKSTFTWRLDEKANWWSIYDLNFKKLKTVSKLSQKEKSYPDWSRIDDTIMVDRVDKLWTPDQDERI